jgi:small subunit ribosomal protein S15
MLKPRKKKSVIKEHGIHETDTGSASVQVGMLTAQISELTAHLKKHSKDNHSRRGLLKMVGRRRRLLRYLEKNNKRAFNAIVKKLDLKK